MAIIPLSSQPEASKAIEHAKQSFKDDKSGSSDTGADVESLAESETEDLDSAGSPDPESYQQAEGLAGDGSTVAEDVIGKRGLYGRFAKKWFSRQGWARENRMSQGMSRNDIDDVERPSCDSKRSDMMELDDFSLARKRSEATGDEDGDEAEADAKAASSRSPSPGPLATPDTRTYELMPKFLRFTKMMLSSRSFYFSYDYDITSRFGATDDQVSPSRPLFRRVDPLVCVHCVLGLQ